MMYVKHRLPECPRTRDGKMMLDVRRSEFPRYREVMVLTPLLSPIPPMAQKAVREQCTLAKAKRNAAATATDGRTSVVPINDASTSCQDSDAMSETAIESEAVGTAKGPSKTKNHLQSRAGAAVRLSSQCGASTLYTYDILPCF